MHVCNFASVKVFSKAVLTYLITNI